MSDWKIVERDGNPEKEGLYYVILIHDEMEYNVPEGPHSVSEEAWEKTGRRFASCDSRWFGLARPGDRWIMKDQPSEGLVWHEETGSYIGESVYAWLLMRKYPDIKLPAGVEWEKEE